MNETKEFKPYIPADKVMPELTVTSVIIGVLLAILFGGANAYLGLRVGMTVSASIPAAVISMGIIRFILRRDSILENNMVRLLALLVNRLQQVLYLHFQHYLCGRRRKVQLCLL